MLMKEQIKNSNHKDIIELLRRIIFAILHIRCIDIEIFNFKSLKKRRSLTQLGEADFAEKIL